MYIAVSNTSNYYTSTDGVSWISRVKPNSESGSPASLKFYDGYFYCIFSTINYNSLYRSQDGVSWTKLISSSSGYPRQFNYVNGKYIFTTSTGYLYKSDDLSTWVSVSGIGLADSMKGIEYFNGLYLFINYSSYSYITYSSDLVNFSSTGSISKLSKNRMIKSSNTLFLIGASGELLSSTNGTTWIKQDSKFGITTLRTMTLIDDYSYFIIGDKGTSITAIYTPYGTVNADATLTRPSTEGFSLNLFLD